MSESKQALYARIDTQLNALLEDVPCALSGLANASALLWAEMPDLNWAGFYLLRGETLVLGPFQGKVACERIPMGKGVCGRSAQQRSAQVVPDVHLFPGHIACDGASRSELVIPLIHGSQVLGVLDLDSPLPARFDRQDAAGLQPVADAIARLLAEKAMV